MSMNALNKTVSIELTDRAGDTIAEYRSLPLPSFAFIALHKMTID